MWQFAGIFKIRPNLFYFTYEIVELLQLLLLLLGELWLLPGHVRGLLLLLDLSHLLLLLVLLELNHAYRDELWLGSGLIRLLLT
jgi:hypothetical protein